MVGFILIALGSLCLLLSVVSFGHAIRVFGLARKEVHNPYWNSSMAMFMIASSFWFADFLFVVFIARWH